MKRKLEKLAMDICKLNPILAYELDDVVDTLSQPLRIRRDYGDSKVAGYEYHYSPETLRKWALSKQKEHMDNAKNAEGAGNRAEAMKHLKEWGKYVHPHKLMTHGAIGALTSGALLGTLHKLQGKTTLMHLIPASYMMAGNLYQGRKLNKKWLQNLDRMKHVEDSKK